MYHAPQLDRCQEHTVSVNLPLSPVNRDRGPFRPRDCGSARRCLRPEEEDPAVPADGALPCISLFRQNLNISHHQGRLGKGVSSHSADPLRKLTSPRAKVARLVFSSCWTRSTVR